MDVLKLSPDGQIVHIEMATQHGHEAMDGNLLPPTANLVAMEVPGVTAHYNPETESYPIGDWAITALALTGAGIVAAGATRLSRIGNRSREAKPDVQSLPDKSQTPADRPAAIRLTRGAYRRGVNGKGVRKENHLSDVA